MENNKKLYIDAMGYMRIKEEVEKLNEELKELNLRRSTVHKPGTDIRWDNAEFTELERSISVVVECLKSSQKVLRNVEILENEFTNEQINFNDILKIKIFFSEDDTEELMIKLVGVVQNKRNMEYEEVTINSPLGKAIYGKTVGDKVPYMVEKNQYFVEILEKYNPEQEKNTSTAKSKVRKPNIK